MTQQPKRLPGERNPEANADAPAHVAREGWMANGHGNGDFGIARAVLALIDWRGRRKAIEARDHSR